MIDAWSHARALGKALIHLAPEDLEVGLANQSAFRVSCTIRTGYEAEAVSAIILHLAHHWFSHHREMVWEDIHVKDEPPPVSFREEMERMIGPLIIAEHSR